VILGRIPTLGLIAWLTLPVAYKTVTMLKTHCQDPVKMAPANLGMICVHNFTAILLIFAYVVVGFDSKALMVSLLPLFTLVFIYIPIAKLLFRVLRLRKTETPTLAIAQT